MSQLICSVSLLWDCLSSLFLAFPSHAISFFSQSSSWFSSPPSSPILSWIFLFPDALDIPPGSHSAFSFLPFLSTPFVLVFHYELFYFLSVKEEHHYNTSIKLMNRNAVENDERKEKRNNKRQIPLSPMWFCFLWNNQKQILGEKHEVNMTKKNRR